MSEKRFFNSYFTEHIIDKVTDKCYPVRYVEGVYELTDLLNELAEENKQLKKENERLKNKLNVTALELVNEVISMGKAVEISEMSYREFIDYRAENGKPMELQL